MGSACCVPVKNHNVTKSTGGESLGRDVTRSPSWSFQRDSRGRSMKSSVDEALAENIMTPSSDLSMSSYFSTVVKDPGESSIPNHSFSLPSIFPTPTAGPSSSRDHHHHHHSNSTPTRWAHRSLGQLSDSQMIMYLKSPDSSTFEGRASFVLSTYSNEVEAGSQCGSSDRWSVHTFSELVSSSQRGRWSFDSECFGSGRRKISASSSRLSNSSSMDLQSCGICMRPLCDKSAGINQKFIANIDLSSVAVLACKHVFHAECLEPMTDDADKYDPPCPICMVDDKHSSKGSRKGFWAEAEMKAKNLKISRKRVVDSYLDGGSDVFDCQEDSELRGKVSKSEASSSTRSSVGKPFSRKHFSLGSKWKRSLSENDSPKKEGIWPRYRKS